MPPRSEALLVVDDSPEDREAIVQTLRRCGHEGTIFTCTDGDEALDFLHHRGAYADPSFPRPDVVLLDLNMPRTSGNEVLADLKHDESLRCIPVVVFSSSGDPVDIHTSFATGANSYCRKPNDTRELRRILSTLEHYWFDVAELPCPRRK